MTTSMLLFKRAGDETRSAFAGRLHNMVSCIAEDAGAKTVILFVDDGEVGSPPEAAAMPSTFDGALLLNAPGALPESSAAYQVSRRVIKARRREPKGARSEGFTVVCPSVRAPFLDHEQFDRHWRDNHSRIHVASSPGTCHYEQLAIDRSVTPGAPDWDGIGLLSFESASEYTERLFGSLQDRDAIFADIDRFLDLARGETLPASEFVYRDDDLAGA
jgi:EthD domain